MCVGKKRETLLILTNTQKKEKQRNEPEKGHEQVNRTEKQIHYIETLIQKMYKRVSLYWA